MTKQINIITKDIVVTVDNNEKTVGWNGELITVSSNKLLSLVRHFVSANGPIVNLHSNNLVFENGSTIRLFTKLLNSSIVPVAMGQLTAQVSAGASLSLLISSIQQVILQSNIKANNNKLLNNVSSPVIQSNLSLNKLNVKLYWAVLQLPA